MRGSGWKNAPLYLNPHYHFTSQIGIATISSHVYNPSADWATCKDLLVECGDLLQFLPEVRAGFDALEERNADKDNRPQDYPDELFQVLAYQRMSFYTPWRQVQGHAKLICHLLGSTYPLLDHLPAVPGGQARQQARPGGLRRRSAGPGQEAA